MMSKNKKGKTVHEKAFGYCDEIQRLQPTREEIDAYADLHEDDYGVVTYSKSKDGAGYFIRLHDTWNCYMKTYSKRITI